MSAYTSRVTTVQSLNFTQTVNLDTTRKLVRVSANKDLIDRIKEVATENFFLEAKYNRHWVALKNAPKLLRAMCWLIEDGEEVIVRSDVLQNLLSKLESSRRLDSAEANEFRSQIQTCQNLTSYVASLQKTRDVNKAVALAYYYRARSGEEGEALFWLCQAAEYAGRRGLAKYADVERFFSVIGSIKSASVFDSQAREVFSLACKSGVIKRLQLPLSTSYTPGRIEKMAEFLKVTSSVEEVVISGSFNPANEEEGYKLQLGDDGLVKIVDAIASNQNSVVHTLDVSRCGLSDVSAEKLLELLKASASLTTVVVTSNPKIGDKMRKALEDAQKPRSCTVM